MTGHLYFIGIAGHTMRGLALAARDNGYTVTGLDEPAVPPGSDWLNEHNIIWWRNFDPIQLEGVTAVIVTGAHITSQSPPILEAKKRGILIQSYAQFFGALTKKAHVIAVAGTHGKTTTTALIAWLLESAGRHPDYLIGIQPFNFPASVHFDGSDIAVVEADEYKASSLETKSKAQYYHPNTLILTAVEHDHPDLFLNLAAVKRRFTEIVTSLPQNGQLIACAQSDNVLIIAKKSIAPVITYGHQHGDYRARNVTYLPQGIEFEVEQAGGLLGHLAIGLYGQHNVLNTLAAVAAVLAEGLTFNDVLMGAATFHGAYRRFNIIGDPEADVTVVDDYAHHPTEVATNLDAAKLHFPGRRIVAVFRPHTYTRTAALLSEYHAAFDDADVVYVTDIEGAREAGKSPHVSGADIVSGLGKKAQYIDDRSQLLASLEAESKPGDVLLCFTVSGYQNIAEELAEKLK